VNKSKTEFSNSIEQGKQGVVVVAQLSVIVSIEFQETVIPVTTVTTQVMGPGILKTLTQFIMMVLTPMAVTKIQLKIAMIVAFQAFES
jgi:hypothetical protein